MSVRVDTSVWVGHFKQRNECLVALLEEGRGCGFVDMSLLASALLGDQVPIWMADKRLA